MFRAERVQLFDIMFPRESAYTVISQMGWFEHVHLVDLQSQMVSTARPYYPNLKRCEVLSSKLEDIEMLLRQLNMPLSRCPNFDGFLERLALRLNEKNNSSQFLLDQYEQDVDSRLAFLDKQQANLFKIIDQRNRLYEQKSLMLQGQEIIFKDYKFSSRIQNNYQGSLRLRSASESEVNRSLRMYTKNRSRDVDFKLNCLAGSIVTADIEKFHRLLFRASKGNVWFNAQPILRDDVVLKLSETKVIPDGLIDSKSYQPLDKSTFFVFFQAGLHDTMRRKLVKLCETFNAIFYELPDDGQQYESVFARLQDQIQEVESLVEMTSIELISYATYFTGIHAEEVPYDEIYKQGYASYIEEVRLVVQIEKAVYYHMNFLEPTGNMIKGTFWCPTRLVDSLQESLRQKCQSFQINQNVSEAQYEPPSYLRVNSFTWAFQELVSTYGTPRYGEINPALFTIVTFPFLFGIMFGDIGHGFLFSLLGLYLLFRGQRMVQNTYQEYRADPVECRDTYYLYKSRYMLFMMGLFSMFCGFVYNDLFSLSINFSNTCYQDKLKVPDCYQSFGLDGVWARSDNELTMTNSFKMKLSIVVGVIQMTFGILLKGVNNIASGSAIDFFCEFLPQLLFMLATFGYMTFLIIIKWLTPFTNTSEAPSIITTLLNMGFQMGGVEGPELFPQQAQIQRYLLIVAVVAMPWMLYRTTTTLFLAKPIIRVIKHRLGARRVGHVELQDEQVELAVRSPAEILTAKVNGQMVQSREAKEHGNFQVDEVVIEQCIEAIEFVLGSVSNTASYLRLWALSLAHNQLSSVFFQKTLGAALTTGSVPYIVGNFFVFALSTFMVLMCMDSLECFLHALRLHWVEFQNKFYKADGYAFQYFSYRRMLQDGKDYNTRN